MTIKWAPSRLDRYSHAVDPLAHHPVDVLTAECGHQLGVAAPLYDDPPGLTCPDCVLHQLARATGASAESCGCRAEVAGLRAMLTEFIELADAPGLSAGQRVNRLEALAHRARDELDGLRATALAALATRWIAAQLPAPGPAEEGDARGAGGGGPFRCWTGTTMPSTRSPPPHRHGHGRLRPPAPDQRHPRRRASPCALRRVSPPPTRPRRGLRQPCRPGRVRGHLRLRRGRRWTVHDGRAARHAGRGR